MKITGHWSQIIPVILMWCYIILFFFTGLQEYADLYNTIVLFIDTFLFVLGFLFFCSDGHTWSFMAKKSLLTVTSLNILTEVCYRCENVDNYYLNYSIIIVVYILSLGIDANKKHNHKENHSS